MKQLLWLLFVSLLSHLGLSMEVAESQNSLNDGISTSFCYNSSSAKFCFTTFRDKTNHTVRGSFHEASDWCKRHVPGSSLIAIDSHDSQKAIENFLGRHGLANATIIMDAQKLKNGNNRKWLWVNGHQTIPEEVRVNLTNDGACVQSVDGKSPVYCTDRVNAQHQYICEYTDLTPGQRIHRHNNKTYMYIAYTKFATWYNARNECLHRRGDLASITNLQSIKNWTRLTENPSQQFWIGLHRIKWMWNSTGAALSYTNWEGDVPQESSDKQQCICINPRCRRVNKETICSSDRKWKTCDCNETYVFVCQKEESSDVSTTKIAVTGEVTPKSASTSITSRKSDIPPASSASTPTTSTKATRAITPTTTTTVAQNPIATSPTTSTTRAISSSTTQLSTSVIPTVIAHVTAIADKYTAIEMGEKTVSTSSMTRAPFMNLSENQATAFTPSSTGLLGSFKTTVIILVLLLLLAVIFIIVALFVIIRKRKDDSRNYGSSTKNTKQNDTVSPVYATVVPGNRLSDATAPAGNTIYADIEMTQQTAPSKNAIYASINITKVIYAEPNKPMKSSTQKSEAVKEQGPIYHDPIEVKPGSGGAAIQDSNAVYTEPMKLKRPSEGSTMKNTAQNETVSSVYATVVPDNRPSEGTAPAVNPIYADIEMKHQPMTSNNTIYASVQPTNVIYSELNKPMKSPTQKGGAVKEQGLIYQDAIEVKHGAKSGGVALQDPSTIYAEPMKLKKSS